MARFDRARALQASPSSTKESACSIATIVLGVHIVVKFAFFALLYRRRRATLDKQYGAKPYATTASDVVLMVVTVVIAAFMLGAASNP